MNWFNKLKAEVNSFLEKATKEEIQAALERVNYAFYNEVDVPILSFHDKIHEWKGSATFKSSFRLSERIMIQSEGIHLEEMIISADNYVYSLAA
jgi:hypothetical protein